MSERSIRWWSLRAITVILTSLLLSGCGGASPSDGATQEAQTLSGHGLSISLPSDWDGRISKQGRHYATVLQAGNFRLPPDDIGLGEKAVEALESRSERIYINIHDLGPPDPGRSNLWVDATLPVSMGRSDFGIFEGVGPCAVCEHSLARRWVVVKGHALIVLVSFGTRDPEDSMLARANEVLASFSVEPA
jgi:hypothetical protein